MTRRRSTAQCCPAAVPRPRKGTAPQAAEQPQSSSSRRARAACRRGRRPASRWLACRRLLRQLSGARRACRPATWRRSLRRGSRGGAQHQVARLWSRLHTTPRPRPPPRLQACTRPAHATPSQSVRPARPAAARWACRPAGRRLGGPPEGAAPMGGAPPWGGTPPWGGAPRPMMSMPQGACGGRAPAAAHQAARCRLARRLALLPPALGGGGCWQRPRRGGPRPLGHPTTPPPRRALPPRVTPSATPATGLN